MPKIILHDFTTCLVHDPCDIATIGKQEVIYVARPISLPLAWLGFASIVSSEGLVFHLIWN